MTMRRTFLHAIIGLALCVTVLAASGACLWPRKPEAPAAKPAAGEFTIDTQRWLAGVPLGGIGAGKVELLTDGSFGNLTINNNWTRPIAGPRACFGAVRVASPRGAASRLLRLRADREFSGTLHIARTLYRGWWPFARVDFLDPVLPADVHLEAFSPITPGDLKDSSLPAAVFRFTVTNIDANDIDATIVMSWQNLIGIGGDVEGWNSVDGNDQREERAGGLRGVRFLTRQRYAGARANCIGEYYLGAREDGSTITIRRTWDASLDAIPFWQHLTETGKLDASPLDAPVGSDGGYLPAAAVASRFRVPRGGKRDVVFVLAWHTPSFFTPDGVDQGHYYTSHFDNAAAVASYVDEHLDRLHARTREWQQLIEQASVPRWFQEQLVNSASTMSSSTLLSRGSQFAFISNPGDGRLGSIEAATTGRAFCAMFYPDLDRSRLELAADCQHSDGAIPSDCGGLRDGIGPAKAGVPSADAACAFVLQALHHYRWTGNRRFLDRMIPKIAAVMGWLERNDPDGDGFPGEGGTTAARATSYLAALLATEDILNIALDRDAATTYRTRHEKLSETLARELWNGYYFDRSFDPATSRREALCSIDMLAGEWLGQQIGLGRTIGEPMTQSALRSILKLNAVWSPRLPPDDVRADISYQSRTTTLPRLETYLAALLIREGYTDDAFNLLKRTHDAVYASGRCAWDAPEQFVAATGEPVGPRAAFNSASSWWSLAALSGANIDAATNTLFLSPRLPPGERILRVPVFLPGFWGQLDCSAGGRCTLRVVRNFGEDVPQVKRVIAADARYIGPLIMSRFIRELKRPFAAIPGAKLRVSLPRPAQRPFVLASPATVPVQAVAAPGPVMRLDVTSGKAISIGAPIRVENVEPDPLPGFVLVAPDTEPATVTFQITGLTQPRYACYVRGRRRSAASAKQLAEGFEISLPGHFAAPDHVEAQQVFSTIAEHADKALGEVRAMKPAPEKALIVQTMLVAFSKAAGEYRDAVLGSIRSEVMLEPTGAPPSARPGAALATGDRLAALRTAAREHLAAARAAAQEQFGGTPAGNTLLAALVPVEWSIAVKPGWLVEVTATGGSEIPDLAGEVFMEAPSGWRLDASLRPLGRIAAGRTASTTFRLTPPAEPLPGAQLWAELRLKTERFGYSVSKTAALK